MRLQVDFTAITLWLIRAVLLRFVGNAETDFALILTRSRFHSPKSDSILLVQLCFGLFAECLLIDVAVMLRIMLPPFEQSGVSKCFSLKLFCVNQNWVIHLFLNAFYILLDSLP